MLEYFLERSGSGSGPFLEKEYNKNVFWIQAFILWDLRSRGGHREVLRKKLCIRHGLALVYLEFAHESPPRGLNLSSLILM